MKTIKAKGLDIKVPRGGAFTYKTPELMPAGHILGVAVGKRGSGKSVGAINLIRNMEYDRVFVISPTFKSNNQLMNMLPIDQDDVYEDVNDPSCIDKIVEKIEAIRDDMVAFKQKIKEYQKFKKLLNDPFKPIPDDMLVSFYNNGSFEAPEWKYGLDRDGNPNRPFCMLLVDDAQGSKIFSSKKIDGVSIRHRHIGDTEDDSPSIGLSLMFLVQNYKSRGGGGISRTLRNNATLLMVFKSKDKAELEQIKNEVAGEVNETQFQEVYEKATAEPHGFLMVDLHKKPSHPSMFRANLNTFLVPSQN
jgi:hypothetical protein